MSGGAVTHVVVVIVVGFAIHLSVGKLGARVVHECIVHDIAFAGGCASRRTPETIVGVFML